MNLITRTACIVVLLCMQIISFRAIGQGRLDSLKILYEQAPLDTTKAFWLREIASHLYDKEKYNDLDSVTDELLVLSDELNYPNGVLYAHFAKGDVAKSAGRYKKAISHFYEYLSIAQKVNGPKSITVADAYNNLGISFRRNGNHDLAEEYYLKALAIKSEILGPDHIDVAYFYNNIGIIYDERGNYDMALEYYKKALEITFNATNKQDYRLSMYYNNIGIVYLFKGAHDQAIEWLKKSLAVRIADRGATHSSVANSYNNLGSVYKEKGEYDLALEYFAKALNIYRKTRGEQHILIGASYENIGMTYQSKKDYSKAYHYLQKSLQISREVLGEDDLLVAETYYNFGVFYSDQYLYNEALPYFFKASLVQKQVLSAKNAVLGKTYLGIAKAFESKGQYQKALDFYQKALVANIVDFNDSTNYEANPTIEHYFDQFLLLNTLVSKARILYELYEREQQLAYLENSLSAVQLTDILIDKIRQSHVNASDKLKLGKLTHEAYGFAIDIAWRLAEETGDDTFLHKAFMFSEKNKAPALMESFTDSFAKRFSNIPDSLIAEEKRLRTEIAFYQSELNDLKVSEESEEKVRQIESQIFKRKRQFEDLVAFFETQFPKYHSIKHSDNIMEVSDIQRKLNSGDLLLEYFIQNEQLYIFCISKDHFKLLNLPFGSRTQTKIAELFNYFKYAKTELNKKERLSEFSALSHESYQSLIDPAIQLFENQQIERLIIVPDGQLWHINFDILLSEESDGDDFKSLDYLIKKYALSYAYSASNFFSSKLRAPGETKKECLAFSFSDKTSENIRQRVASTRADAGDLPGSRREIRNISKVLKGDYYYGSTANELNFKQNASDYAILHLALHGDINESDPMSSKLYFTSSEDTIEDNLLYAHELYNMDLNAELAVLSSCNTGAGKLAKGEGLLSLGRAFSYAGVNSLLVSRWEVSDASSPEIMTSFYRALKKGKSKDEALRIAKIEYLNNADNVKADPFYWGGFVVLGNNSAVNLKLVSQQDWFMYIGLAVLIMTVLALFARYIRMARSK